MTASISDISRFVFSIAFFAASIPALAWIEIRDSSSLLTWGRIKFGSRVFFLSIRYLVFIPDAFSTNFAEDKGNSLIDPLAISPAWRSLKFVT